VFALWFVLRFALRFVVRFALRFTLAGEAMPGVWLAGAGLRGFAFFDNSLCTGNCP
jgi:hypothetical protein